MKNAVLHGNPFSRGHGGMVDALVSDASGETRGSSNLLGRTNLAIIYFINNEGDKR